jgi:hypothetical protein
MSDPLEGLPAGNAYGHLRYAMYVDIAYLLWGLLDDVELDEARAAMAGLAVERTSVMRRRYVEARSCERSARRRPSSPASRASTGSSARSGSP